MRRLDLKLGLLVSLISSSSIAGEAKPNADEIMKKLNDTKTPASVFTVVTLTISKGGSSVEKAFKSWSMKVNDDEQHTLIEFTKPNNTKILAHSRRKGNDDRWIKTSSGAPKRVANSGGDQYFVQSHFSYGDLDFARSKNFKHEALCEGAKCEVDYKGAPHYRIKSVPDTADADFAYLVNVVRVSDSSVDKVEYYAKDGKLIRELMIDERKDVKGYQIPTMVVMKMADSGDSSALKITEVEIESDKVKKQLFDKNLL
ncbi:MAG: outer membrane lipoprotein-sorting protein [Deltaproteobacteria bacterium]|nr:outer membrane lipoprotein-sorting protein [Deltaproteobacteria bacterium]